MIGFDEEDTLSIDVEDATSVESRDGGDCCCGGTISILTHQRKRCIVSYDRR